MRDQRRHRLFQWRKKRRRDLTIFERLPVHEQIRSLAGTRAIYHQTTPLEGYILLYHKKYSAKPKDGFQVRDGEIVEIDHAYMFYAVVRPAFPFKVEHYIVRQRRRND